MRITPTASRRNVVIDIETVSLDPHEPKGALSAVSGRIVCICALIDDGHTITEESLINADESKLLVHFWDLVFPGDVFVGFNVFGFDLPFIRQRSWVLSVRPSRRVDLRRFYSADFIDCMEVWSNWGATKHVGLDKIGNVLGFGGKIGHGCDVAEWWAAGDLQRIAEYCREDVRLTYKIFCRLMFQQLPERYRSATEDSCQLSLRLSDETSVESKVVA